MLIRYENAIKRFYFILKSSSENFKKCLIFAFRVGNVTTVAKIRHIRNCQEILILFIIPQKEHKSPPHCHRMPFEHISRASIFETAVSEMEISFFLKSVFFYS